MNFSNCDKITTGSLNNTELEFVGKIGGSYDHFVATIKILVVNGTGIQFSVGQECTANSHKWQVGDTLLLTFNPNVADINFKSDSVNDEFVISF